jgi:hypothetical protein
MPGIRRHWWLRDRLNSCLSGGPGRDRFPNKHWRERADAATAGHTLSHTAKPRWGDHGFSVFPAIDL